MYSMVAMINNTILVYLKVDLEWSHYQYQNNKGNYVR